jgi:predicted NUDIX family phosphoesterase
VEKERVNEQVLVFPEFVLNRFSGEFRDGIITNRDVVAALVQASLSRDVSVYWNRAEAETDPSWKQIIPYVLLRRGDALFAYQRTKKGGESRLHDRWSLGVGGHINPVDGDGMGLRTYRAAVRREVLEETGLHVGESALEPVAVIYTPVDDVGRVHVGFVHVIGVPEGTRRTDFQDEALAHGGFVDLPFLRGMIDRFEQWSQLALRVL